MSNFSNHSCFRGLHNVTQLSGFSGALVALLDADTSNIRVRKAALEAGSSDRLRDQAIRQFRLAKILKGVVNVPAILSDGEEDGCYWYDMEYVAGLDAIEYLAAGTRTKIDNILHQIGAILEAQARFVDDSASGINLHQRVTTKLLEIDATTGGRHSLQLNAIMAAMPDKPIVLRPTIVHGDLTLENVLIDRKEQMWLIDTIPSPFDHYWIDLAKLFQDLVGRWFLHRGRTLSIGLIKTMADGVLKRAITLDPRYLDYHTVLLALSFARILPYCRSKDDIDFVSERIAIALNVKPHLRRTGK